MNISGSFLGDTIAQSYELAFFPSTLKRHIHNKFISFGDIYIFFPVIGRIHPRGSPGCVKVTATMEAGRSIGRQDDE